MPENELPLEAILDGVDPNDPQARARAILEYREWVKAEEAAEALEAIREYDPDEAL